MSDGYPRFPRLDETDEIIYNNSIMKSSITVNDLNHCYIIDLRLLSIDKITLSEIKKKNKQKLLKFRIEDG